MQPSEKNINTVSQFYNSSVCEKLASQIMINGKKKTVLKVIFSLLNNYNHYSNFCMLTALIYSLKPSLETRKVRRGSKYYDVPFFMKKKRSLLLALKWFTKAVKSRKEIGLGSKFIAEFEDLMHKSGSAYKEAKVLKKRVLSNTLYSHYRWK